ncbi:MAG: hypothetical protein RLZZ511_3349 [Cyanobacteriota bacterium]|jgi:hypothetical protein
MTRKTQFESLMATQKTVEMPAVVASRQAV